MQTLPLVVRAPHSPLLPQQCICLPPRNLEKFCCAQAILVHYSGSSRLLAPVLFTHSPVHSLFVLPHALCYRFMPWADVWRGTPLCMSQFRRLFGAHRKAIARDADQMVVCEVSQCRGLSGGGPCRSRRAYRKKTRSAVF